MIDAPDQFQRFPRGAHEIAAVLWGIRFHPDDHAEAMCNLAELGEKIDRDTHRLGLGDGPPEAVFRRAEDQDASAEPRGNSDYLREVEDCVAPAYVVGEELQLGSSEEQRLHGDNLDAAVDPVVAIGVDGASLRFRGILPYLRGCDLDP